MNWLVGKELSNGESLLGLMLSIFLGEHGEAGGEVGKSDAGAGGCLPQSRSECQVKDIIDIIALIIAS